MNNCPKCQDLRRKIKIKLPADLNNIIFLIRQFVTENILSILENPNDIWLGKPADFAKLSKNDWDDLVLFDFKCNHCEQTFKLRVETYHGAGGEWQPEI